VTAAETSGEAAMFPRMINMVMSVIPAGVAHPFFSAVNVRSVWMSRPIIKMPVLLAWMRRVDSRWAVFGNILASANLWPSTMMLCHS
jgi:hypothetical protein